MIVPILMDFKYVERVIIDTSLDGQYCCVTMFRPAMILVNF